jgi:hypothetical protein
MFSYEDQQKQNIFRFSVQAHELCDCCKLNKKDIQFYLQTPSYYRCKPSGHYYFCNQECMDKYKNAKTCFSCHYQGDLQELNGKMYCTNYPGQDMTCYQKAKGDFKCDYCLKDKNCWENNCYIFDHPEYNNMYMCGNCYEPYQNKMNEGKCCFMVWENKIEKIEQEKESGWIHLYEDESKKLLDLICKNSKFICNKCHYIELISNGIFIVDGMNLCRDCAEKHK